MVKLSSTGENNVAESLPPKKCLMRQGCSFSTLAHKGLVQNLGSDTYN